MGDQLGMQSEFPKKGAFLIAKIVYNWESKEYLQKWQKYEKRRNISKKRTYAKKLLVKLVRIMESREQNHSFFLALMMRSLIMIGSISS